jgi:allophanate hydrolase subunit 2
MKNAFVLGGIFALATILGSTATLARSGGGGMHLSGSAYAQPDSLMIVDDGATSLARADKHAHPRRQQARLLPSRTEKEIRTGQLLIS